MDEHVLRGNTGILKCHIPSFVADFVTVSAWIDDENNEYYAETHNFGHDGIGTTIFFLIFLIFFHSIATHI